MTENERLPLGDVIWQLAGTASDVINASEVATSMRNRQLSPERYQGVIAAVYPVVVGFNRALIRSLSKIDNVTDSWLIKGLAVQLKEEQIHNDMWRAMLTEFGINHVCLWEDITNYLSHLSREDLDSATKNVIRAISSTPSDFESQSFRNATFPDPSLALFHHMYSVAEDSNLNFWAHFASQSAIECTIYGFVSESVYPGLMSESPLDRGARSTVWWKEHAKQSSPDGRLTAEEKHLHIAKTNLNRLTVSDGDTERILVVVKDSLALFSGAIRWHDLDKGGQWDVARYLS